MRFEENAVFDALVRSQHFFDENGVALTGVVDLGTARKRLDDVAASFTSHAFDQDAGSRGAKGETAKQRQLRFQLRQQQMEPVAVIARRNLRTTPEFVALQMPKPSVFGQAFLASARGMADAATIHQDTLVTHGLPSTFLDTFKAGVTKFEASLKDRETSRNRRIGATKGLSEQVKEGRTVLSVLDALMKQALADNQPLFRVWQAVRLIRRKPGGANAATVTPTPAVPPTASPAPASAGGQTPTPTPLPTGENSPVSAAA